MSKFYSMVSVYNNQIIDSYYDENGKKKIKQINFKPSIFYEENLKSSKFKTLYGQTLIEKKFDCIKDYRDYIGEHKDVISLYGNIGPEYQYINQTYKKIDFHYELMKIFFIDIECVSDDGSFPFPGEAKWPINSLVIKDKHRNIFYALSLKPYDKTKTILKINPKNIKFKHCIDEEDLLKTFIQILKKEQPDFLIGWYANGFDFPYIINRCYNILSDKDVKKMSMFKKVKVVESKYNGRIEFRTVIGGITLLDYLELYKKYTFTPRSNYTLDHISSVELGEAKIKYDEYDNFIEFWNNDPQKFVDYNIYDVELMDMLDNFLDLVNLHCQLSFKARCNFIDALGTVKIWDILIYHYLRDRNILIPPIVMKDFIPFAGAYVKEPEKKIHDWVASMDLNSLYPHLIMQYNISPETLIDGKIIPGLMEKKKLDDRFLSQEFSPDPRAILAANGQYFSKGKKGFLPVIMHEIYEERKAVKKEMLIKKQELVNIEEELKKRGLLI